MLVCSGSQPRENNQMIQWKQLFVGATLSVAALTASLPVQAQVTPLTEGKPCTTMFQLMCEKAMLNVVVAIQDMDPNAKLMTQAKIDDYTAKIDKAGYATGAVLRQKYERATLLQMLQDADVMMTRIAEKATNNEYHTLDEINDECQEGALSLGKKYDSKPSVASYSAPTRPSVAKEESMDSDAVDAGEFERKSEELMAAVKKYEAEMMKENETLKQMDETKPANERSKKDWEDMDAQAMKVLEAVQKTTDAMKAHGAHTAQKWAPQSAEEYIK